MSKVLKTLGNLDALLFETFDGFDHLTTNSSFKAYKTEVNWEIYENVNFQHIVDIIMKNNMM